MKQREHTAEDTPENMPVQDQEAKEAYAICLKEGRPQGHTEQNCREAESQLQPTGSDHSNHHDHRNHHAHMAADFRNRFWISLALALPILPTSPLLQKLFGLRESIRFPGDSHLL
jgi:hypothetical protein